MHMTAEDLVVKGHVDITAYSGTVAAIQQSSVIAECANMPELM